MKQTNQLWCSIHNCHMVVCFIVHYPTSAAAASPETVEAPPEIEDLLTEEIRAGYGNVTTRMWW